MVEHILSAVRNCERLLAHVGTQTTRKYILSGPFSAEEVYPPHNTGGHLLFIVTKLRAHPRVNYVSLQKIANRDTGFTIAAHNVWGKAGTIPPNIRDALKRAGYTLESDKDSGLTFYHLKKGSESVGNILNGLHFSLHVRKDHAEPVIRAVFSTD